MIINRHDLRKAAATFAKTFNLHAAARDELEDYVCEMVEQWEEEVWGPDPAEQDEPERDPDEAYDRWRDDGDGPLPMAAKLSLWRMK